MSAASSRLPGAVQHGSRAFVTHPLMGARLSTLLHVLTSYGAVPPGRFGLVALMVLSAAARAPFRFWETARFNRLRRSRPPPQAPLFIIGHWRTGTTHLHALLGCSPAFGHISPIASGLPDELLTLGTLLRPWLEKALPETRHVDRVAVTPTSPQEDEIPLANLQPLSVFHAVYFPRRFRSLVDRGVFLDGAGAAEIARWEHLVRVFAEKVAFHQGADRIVIKNPVYTARISRLQGIWPESRFIHIRRCPYEVFVSTRHYYRTLLPQVALQPYDHIDIDQVVLTTFSRLMAAYEEQRRQLAADQIIEVSYERLRRAPLEVLAEIHDQLALPGWDAARPRIAAYLETVSGYRTNRYEISGADRARVDAHWADAIARWEAMRR